MPTMNQRLKKIDTVIKQGPFYDTWESLGNYRIPQWYKNAKFGIFIHWGVYSVPAHGEWYARLMNDKTTAEYKYHLKKFGPHAVFGYKDFIPLFKADKFDPASWASLFKKAGAKYVVPVAEHHDGFAMYDCSLSEWNAVKMGPKRDIISEIADAVRNEGMVFGLSSHRAEHWWFLNTGLEIDSDVKNPKYSGLYGPVKQQEEPPDKQFLDNWLARTCELVDKYNPGIVWFDWWIEEAAFAPYLKKFGAYYYNKGIAGDYSASINYKCKAFPPDTAVFDIERGQLSGIRPLFWQTDTAISNVSWGYHFKNEYKSAKSLTGNLIDIVSKNGTMLLNVGPKPNGTITKEEERILLEIGRWLDLNGEAIYGTRPWKVYGEGPTQVMEGAFNETKRQEFTHEDIRFTARGNILYAILLGWPPECKVNIKTLSENNKYAPLEITSISLLGNEGTLKWLRNRECLTVTLPQKKPYEYAYVLKIEHKG